VSELIKIFIAGITLGNGPCLFICLPIVLPYIIASSKPRGQNHQEKSEQKKGYIFALKLTLLFSISRLISYSILGFLSVLFFKFVSNLAGGQNFYLKTFLGILIILAGVIYLLDIKKNFIFQSPACSYLHKKILEKQNLNIFLFGLLIGFSPCGPLSAILAYIAAMSENPLSGLIAGFSFGLGTLMTPLIPLGVFTGFVADKLKKYSGVFTVLRFLSAIILIYFGINLVFLTKNL